MAWVKLDDQAPRNHKVLKAGPAAAWMWVCGIAHCQAHMSEGFIPEIAVPMIGITGKERAMKLADVLVDVGLFERVDGGYLVHDYLDFNETREQALARKVSLSAKRAAAGRAGGLAKVANAKQTTKAKRSPDPTRPDPTLKEKNKPRAKRGAIRGAVCPHEARCKSTSECIAKCIGEGRASA